MPPSGVTEGPAFLRHGVKMRGGQPPQQGGLSEHRLPTMNSAMRMDQIIEESLGNHSGPGRGRGPPQPSNLEGLACPRTKSPNPPQPTSMMNPSVVQRPPHLGRGPPPGAVNSAEDFHEYPAMEGLGARFSSIMEKRHAASSSTPSEAGGPPPNHMLERSFSHPPHNGPPNFNGPHPAPGGPPGPPSSNASIPGYPGPGHPGVVQHPGPPPPGSYPNSGPPPTGPPPHGYPQIRKRPSHSTSGLPVLPPKKQHMDMPEEFKYQKGM